MIEGEFAYAFGVGMAATFNPCGFAMLPAYLAFFLGQEDDSEDTSGAVLRALVVGATLTAGFVVVFGVLGIAIEATSITIQRYLPWVTMIIGVGLVGVGVLYLTGRELDVPLPRIEAGGSSRHLGSVFLFGISYAVASLSCTIPLFLVAVSGTFSSESFAAGVMTFLAYGLGMGLVVATLTMALALARRGLVTNLRRVLPYVTRVSGALLVVAGCYLTWYGWWERAVIAGDDVPEGPVGRFTDLSGQLTDWVQRVGPTRIGLVLGAVVVVALVLAWGWRASARPSPPRSD